MKLEELTSPRITDLRDAVVRKGDLVLIHPEAYQLVDTLRIINFKEFCKLQGYKEDWCFRASRIFELSPPDIFGEEIVVRIEEYKGYENYYFPVFSPAGFSVGKEIIARELIATRKKNFHLYISYLESFMRQPR